MDGGFLANLLSIVLIDLLLAGDNAIVIAMAVRHLPSRQRKQGILLGALAAVMLRIGLTFFIARLLEVPYVRLLGGLAVLWVGVKLFDAADSEVVPERHATSIWEAAKLVVVADVTMSLDNMLAVGAASHGSLTLLLVGLCLSIPFVVFTSDLLSRLMNRHGYVVYLGAAILGRVSAEMIATDPFTLSHVRPHHLAVSLFEAVLAASVVLGGRLRARWATRDELA